MKQLQEVAMTIARNKQILLEKTQYYHCVSRCVRGACLSGKDPYSGHTVDHRSEWLQNIALDLSDSFCINIAGFCILPDGYQLVLFVNLAEAASISDLEVARRYRRIYRGSAVVKRFANGEQLSPDDQEILSTELGQLRQILTSIGKFMGYLNQTIARWANDENDIRGPFWHRRYASRAIESADQLVTTLVDTDMASFRSGHAVLPEEARFSGLACRLSANGRRLMPFSTDNSTPWRKDLGVLPLSFRSYLQLIDQKSRTVTWQNRRSVEADTPALQDRLATDQRKLAVLPEKMTGAGDVTIPSLAAQVMKESGRTSVVQG